jgi:hypothetical protein
MIEATKPEFVIALGRHYSEPARPPLALNKLIGDYDTMNADTLPKVRMPNRDGFIIRFPEAL